jgi:hypothetical protein
MMMMMTTKTLSTLAFTTAMCFAAGVTLADSQSAPAASRPGVSQQPAPAVSAKPEGKAQGAAPATLPAVPATPAGITELLEVREFRVTEQYEHRFSKEKPMVTAGYILALRAPSEYLAPRQVEMPVLMVGTTPVEPMNIGFASGQIVVIVPSELKADGSLALDLTKTPIYFAPPSLPEQIDQAFAAQLLGLAERSGIAAQSDAVVGKARAQAQANGGDVAVLANRDALNAIAGSMVRRYAADEAEAADALEGKTDSTPRPVK